jgi:hypothetical protein
MRKKHAVRRRARGHSESIYGPPSRHHEKLAELASKINRLIRDKGSKAELRKARAAYSRVLRKVTLEARAALKGHALRRRHVAHARRRGRAAGVSRLVWRRTTERTVGGGRDTPVQVLHIAITPKGNYNIHCASNGECSLSFVTSHGSVLKGYFKNLTDAKKHARADWRWLAEAKITHVRA